MKVYINEEFHEGINTIGKLREVVGDLRIKCKKDNKVISIVADGKNIDPDFLDKLETGIDKVEIVTKSPFDLVVEGLVEGTGYLPRLINGLNETSNHFREGNINRGIKKFQQGIDGLNWLNHLLVGLDLYIYSDSQFKDNIKCYTDTKEFSGIIKELLSAWENEDYVLISDLVEYELVPVLEKCHTAFLQLLDQLAGV